MHLGFWYLLKFIFPLTARRYFLGYVIMRARVGSSIWIGIVSIFLKLWVGRTGKQVAFFTASVRPTPRTQLLHKWPLLNHHFWSARCRTQCSRTWRNRVYLIHFSRLFGHVRMAGGRVVIFGVVADPLYGIDDRYFWWSFTLPAIVLQVTPRCDVCRLVNGRWPARTSGIVPRIEPFRLY